MRNLAAFVFAILLVPRASAQIPPNQGLWILRYTGPR